MVEFNEDAICRKCGSEDIHTSYVPANDQNPNSFYGPKYKYETLNRRCKRCNYYWAELPLDADDSKENL